MALKGIQLPIYVILCEAVVSTLHDDTETKHQSGNIKLLFIITVFQFLIPTFYQFGIIFASILETRNKKLWFSDNAFQFKFIGQSHCWGIIKERTSP